MTCEMCQKRGKDWDGDDPICAFESGVFSEDNWMCATMNELRDMVEDTERALWNEDSYAALLLYEDDEGCPDYIVMSWYKHRGRTDHCYMLETRESVTIEQALDAIAQHKAREEWRKKTEKLQAPTYHR